MDDLTPAVGVESRIPAHLHPRRDVAMQLLDHRRSVTREALVVDPGDEVSRILELLGRHKLKVTSDR